MALYKPDPVFKGKTHVGIRNALRAMLENVDYAPTRYVIPCAGTFSVVETLVAMGVEPKQVEASDITIYTSTLGFLIDPDKVVQDIGFEVAPNSELNSLKPPCGIKPLAGTQVECAAWILYCVKYSQLMGKSEFLKWQRTEFLNQFEHVFNSYCKTLERFDKLLHGVNYICGDSHAHVLNTVDQPNTMIWYNPPGYSGGYSKMYDTHGHYKWDSPDVPELEPKECPAFVENLRDKQALSFVMLSTWCANWIGDDARKWFVAYVESIKGTTDKTFIFSNKRMKKNLSRTKKRGTFPAKVYPIYDDHTLTEDSKISLVEVDKELALYYYDLFVRELGMTSAEVYYLFMLDGQVAGTIGFSAKQIYVKREPVLFENFGLTLTSERYVRLNRLLMGAITCREFINSFEKKFLINKLTTRVEIIRTTCLSKFPEVKTNRGILKLRSKKILPTGRYHLSYQTTVHEKKYKEVLSDWLSKHAQYSSKEWELKHGEGKEGSKAETETS